MELSNKDKLALAMLAEIHQKLGITDGVDSKLVASALWHDQAWAIQWEHGFLLGREKTPPHVQHVVDVLDMWSFLERAFKDLTPEELEKVKSEAYPYDDLQFPGWDGHDDNGYIGVARFLTENMGRFSEFAGRDFDSHSPVFGRDERMLQVWLPIRKRLGEHVSSKLTADDLIEILRARR